MCNMKALCDILMSNVTYEAKCSQIARAKRNALFLVRVKWNDSFAQAKCLPIHSMTEASDPFGTIEAKCSLCMSEEVLPMSQVKLSVRTWHEGSEYYLWAVLLNWSSKASTSLIQEGEVLSYGMGKMSTIWMYCIYKI